jgi:hypothetical protein
MSGNHKKTLQLGQPASRKRIQELHVRSSSIRNKQSFKHTTCWFEEANDNWDMGSITALMQIRTQYWIAKLLIPRTCAALLMLEDLLHFGLQLEPPTYTSGSLTPLFHPGCYRKAGKT